MPVVAKRGWVIPESPWGAAKCLTRLIFVCVLAFFGWTAMAEGSGEEVAETPGNAEPNGQFAEIIRTFEKETGQAVRVTGIDSSEFTTEWSLNSEDFPRTLEGLAALLGIEDYVATLNKAGTEIELIVLKSRPQAAAQTVPESLPARIENQVFSEEPGVPPLGQIDHEQVLSIYNHATDRESWIDDIVLEQSRLRAQDYGSREEPYLTGDEEEAIARVFKELTSQAPTAGD